MKKKNKIIITIISIIVIICLTIFGIYIYLNTNKLTVSEKNWIDENSSKSTLINVNVLNNSAVFGNNGVGIFYDFLSSFKEYYSLNINNVTYNYGSNVVGVKLGIKINPNENDVIIYTDHYVLISNNSEIITTPSDIEGKTVSILSSDLSYVSKYLSGYNLTFQSFDNIDSLITSDNKYAIVPLHLYLDNILTNNKEIIYHFGDINIYYTLSVTDDIFGSVIKKYYEIWKENFEETYDQNLFTLVSNKLNLTDSEIDEMRSVNYKYGYVNNSPYEVISGGNYGGIVAVYLRRFMSFADVDFTFKKYNNFAKFNKALTNNEIDAYFGYLNINDSFYKTQSGVDVNYVICANMKNNIVLSNLNSLSGKEVYVQNNSLLYTYLNNISDVTIKTYKNSDELVKLNKKDTIILLDSNIYEYYKNHGLENYTIRTSGSLKEVYSFRVKNNSALYKLLNKYISILDSHKILNEGINNHTQTVKYGRVLSLLAKYFIYFLVLFLIVAYFVIRKTKKITIAKKIKKDDKMRFIDQLTLLKNRNYLNENIKSWNNNTIYPQTILIVDLNHVQDINDTKGYEEGDKQIKAAANILIKYQLDNSDIIRTDGNEFVVYLVGYDQKQITNYIHKLNKEFKKLPYDYGAEFGYSMIIDDIKTIEDALNEATKVLKKQKEVNEKKN
ncbi:MAG: GGDEF domain-containing protein [bacterium]|nr:GGDEF domain-containing protein [bacterium]